MTINNFMQKKFKIEVAERLSRVVEVDAVTEADAIARVEAMYNNSEIVLSGDDFDGEAEFINIDRNEVQIMQHNIEWSLEDESVDELDDSDTEHIAYMISEGYSEGELNHTIISDDKDSKQVEKEVRGYWKIIK